MSRNYLDVRSRGFRARTHSKAFTRTRQRKRRRCCSLVCTARRTTFSTRTSQALLTWPSKSVKLPATWLKLPTPSSPRPILSLSSSFFDIQPAETARKLHVLQSTSDNFEPSYGSCTRSVWMGNQEKRKFSSFVMIFFFFFFEDNCRSFPFSFFAKNFGNFSISFERERFLQFNFLRVYILKWKFFEIVSGIRAFSIVRRIIIRVYYLRRNLPRRQV